MDAKAVATQIADILYHDDTAGVEAESLIMESPTKARWLKSILIEAVEDTIKRAQALTKEQVHILQHALGMTDGHAEYRNYYAQEDGDEDCEALVAAGLMIKSHGVPGYDKLSWPLVYYHVTPSGKKIAYANLPPVQKTTRSQRRYLAFLEADSGMSFIEWCRSDHGKAVK